MVNLFILHADWWETNNWMSISIKQFYIYKQFYFLRYFISTNNLISTNNFISSNNSTATSVNWLHELDHVFLTVSRCGKLISIVEKYIVRQTGASISNFKKVHQKTQSKKSIALPHSSHLPTLHRTNEDT